MPVHNIPPVFDSRSRVLILGSFPSVRSRADEFYYAHPQNRFWPVLAQVLGQPEPRDVEQKKALLLSQGIALWDVLQSCDIDGSADDRIRNAAPNDISMILAAADIGRIYTNGTAAHRLYGRLCLPYTGIVDVCLPSTSARAARLSREQLAERWRVVAADK